ncbi:undecaprenyl-diphosphate phosphatase [Thermococcus eurythermalis]|nr:undecaprenyl-diphosphate phosphatase [Thermococcus eurythermalis]
MGTLVEALLSGLIFALTSWFPLSPEGDVASVLVGNYQSFLVPAYLGVTFAVFFHYREKFSRLLIEAMKGIYEAELKYVFFATLFTALIGLPLSKFSWGLSAKISSAVNALIGALIVLLSLATPRRNPIRELDGKLSEEPSILDSLSAGVLQGVALLGPLTRTGAITLALLLPGYSARKALQWSFMVAPAYFILRLLQFGSWEPEGPVWIPFTAFASAFFVSLVLIYLLESLAEKRARLALTAFGIVPIIVFALEVIV